MVSNSISKAGLRDLLAELIVKWGKISPFNFAAKLANPPLLHLTSPLFIATSYSMIPPFNGRSKVPY